MAQVTFHIKPQCASAICEESYTVCISLYRGPRTDAGQSAKSYYECFSGNLGVTGERLAKIILSDIESRTGIKGRLTSPSSENSRNQLGSITFDDIDEWDIMSTKDYCFVESSPGGGDGHGPVPGRPPERWKQSRSASQIQVAPPVFDLDLASRDGGRAWPTQELPSPGFHWVRLGGAASDWRAGRLMLTVRRDEYGEFVLITATAHVHNGSSPSQVARDLAIQLSRNGARSFGVGPEIRIEELAGGQLFLEFVPLGSSGHSPHFVGGFDAIVARHIRAHSHQAHLELRPSPKRLPYLMPGVGASPIGRDRLPSLLSRPSVVGDSPIGRAQATTSPGVGGCACGPECTGGCHA